MRAFKRLCIFGLGLWLVMVSLQSVLTSSLRLRTRLGDFAQRIETFSGVHANCRIWLVGSSPVIFGLSAREIQSATGCSVLNAALHGIPKQVNRYLTLMLENVQPGDVVVLSDRLWTEAGDSLNPCTEGSNSSCFVASLSAVPNGAAYVAMFFSAGPKTDRWGDLIQYPPLAGRLSHAELASGSDLDSRLELLESQVRRIRGRGATPLLTAPPMLATADGLPAVRAQMDSLALRVNSLVGAGVWIDPVVSTDASDFSLDGLHASQSGRQRWTARVVSVLNGSGLSPGPGTAKPSVTRVLGSPEGTRRGDRIRPTV